MNKEIDELYEKMRENIREAYLALDETVVIAQKIEHILNERNKE